jgi:hypothetical protein
MLQKFSCLGQGPPLVPTKKAIAASTGCLILYVHPQNSQNHLSLLQKWFIGASCFLPHVRLAGNGITVVPWKKLQFFHMIWEKDQTVYQNFIARRDLELCSSKFFIWNWLTFQNFYLYSLILKYKIFDFLNDFGYRKAQHQTCRDRWDLEVWIWQVLNLILFITSKVIL